MHFLYNLALSHGRQFLNILTPTWDVKNFLFILNLDRVIYKIFSKIQDENIIQINTLSCILYWRQKTNSMSIYTTVLKQIQLEVQK